MSLLRWPRPPAAAGTRVAERARVAPAAVGTEYLRRAGGLLRKSVIAFACVNQVMALPVADAESFGNPLGHWLGLQPASDVVHDILRQDRSMAAWAARDCLVLLDVLLHSMTASRDDALETALDAVGLRPGPRLAPQTAVALAPEAAAEVLRLANRVLSVFSAFERAGSARTETADRGSYERMFAARGRTAAQLAHDIAAWTGVVIGRLLHTGYLDELPWMSPEFHRVPAMTTAGWYPNPFQMGEIISEEAGVQRFWDGTDWTDRIRQRCADGWREHTKSMFEAPPN